MVRIVFANRSHNVPFRLISFCISQSGSLSLYMVIIVVVLWRDSCVIWYAVGHCCDCYCILDLSLRGGPPVPAHLFLHQFGWFKTISFIHFFSASIPLPLYFVDIHFIFLSFYLFFHGASSIFLYMPIFCLFVCLFILNSLHFFLPVLWSFCIINHKRTCQMVITER